MLVVVVIVAVVVVVVVGRGEGGGGFRRGLERKNDVRTNSFSPCQSLSSNKKGNRRKRKKRY